MQRSHPVLLFATIFPVASTAWPRSTETPGVVRKKGLDLDLRSNGRCNGRALADEVPAAGSVVLSTGISPLPGRNGVFHDLSFPGVRQSLARSINDQGDVLGNVTILHSENSGNFLGLGYFNFVRDTRRLR
ncbi:MAG: hypothetical protein IT167_11035 [Bryobacterales bacterium]|nr:hypothetical protein [Bryobacterales bacterium]